MSRDYLQPDDNARVIVEELQDIGAGVDQLGTMLEVNQREQTAATILAALVDYDETQHAVMRFGPDGAIQELTSLGFGDRKRVMYAVALADALRAELEKVKPP